MLESIKNYFRSFFQNTHQKDKIPEERKWVSNKLSEWKVNLYSNNKNLDSIPQSRIYKKIEELKLEYRKKYK